MDRNTLIGLGLIGIILAVFTYINQPSPEEIQAQQKKAQQELEQRRMLEQAQQADETPLTLNIPENVVAKLDSTGNQVVDSLGRIVYTDTLIARDTILMGATASKEEVPLEITTASEDFKGEVITLENNKILIIGDYDVDGCVSTSLMVNFLKRINVKVNFYIPDRVHDGYGASKELMIRL